jgi:hypothetical protein
VRSEFFEFWIPKRHSGSPRNLDATRLRHGKGFSAALLFFFLFFLWLSLSLGFVWGGERKRKEEKRKRSFERGWMVGGEEEGMR